MILIYLHVMAHKKKTSYTVSGRFSFTMQRTWRRYAQTNRYVTGFAILALCIVGVMTMQVQTALTPELMPDSVAIARKIEQDRKNNAEETQVVTKPAEQSQPPVSATPSASAKVVAPAPSPARNWPITSLYIDPVSDAAAQARAWAASKPADSAAMAKMAAQPQAAWFGDWNRNIQQEVSDYVGRAAAAGKMPVLVAYNIPMRDCSHYSAGGAKSAAEYNAWIHKMVQGIAGRPAAVIIEPDALPMLNNCLDAAGQQSRLSMLSQAVKAFKTGPQTFVYIDAGHPDFRSASVIADWLKQAGVVEADGFSLNVSNFYRTSELIPYGHAVSKLTGGKRFVLDTSRNGNGILSGKDWCNPPGRALGVAPTAVNTGSSLIDALLWIKTPGQSDGTCNGGPSAGQWWPEYALGLARSAGW